MSDINEHPASPSLADHTICHLERENAKLREDVNFGDKERRDAISDLAAANARIVDLEQAWEEIFESRPVNGMSYTEAARALKAQLVAANERAERAEAKAAVIGGEWCAENRAAGRGPCGACAWCCQQASAQSDTLRRALEVCQDALTYGGDRLVVLINSERSKCKGDHWDFWDYLAEKLRLALTSAKSALGQK